MNRNIFLICFVFILCFLSNYVFAQTLYGTDNILLKKDRKLRLITIESTDTNFLIVNSIENFGWDSERGRKTVIDWMLKGDTTNIGIQIDEKLRRLKITVAKDEIVGVEGKSPVLAGMWGAIYGGAGYMYVGDNYYLPGTLLGTLDTGFILLLWWQREPIYAYVALSGIIGLRVFGVIVSPMAADDYNKKLQKKYGVPVIAFNDNKKSEDINIFAYNIEF